MVIDPELERFAASDDASQRRTVIIEATSPKVAAPTRKLPTKGPTPRAQRAGDGAETDGTYKQLTRALRTLGLGQELVSFDAFGYIAVEVNPEQLRRILALPGVAAVRPNRTHRKPKQA